MTSPDTKINVSVHEASGAMSAVHFRWRWGGKIAKHITSVFRSVRPAHRSSNTLLDIGTKSESGISSDSHHLARSNKGNVGIASTPNVQNRRDKGKRKATEESSKSANPKATKGLSSKSIDNMPQSSRGASTSYAGSQISISKACRGSDTNILGREISPSTSKSGSEKRNRFGLFLNWKPTKYQSNTNVSSYTQLPATRTFGIVGGAHPNSRRSEEALRYFRYAQSNEDDQGEGLTAARRASSWGQGDKELTEVVSLTSIERELNDHDMNVGAGGVSRDGEFGIGVAGPPPSSFPSFLNPALAEETFDDVNERYGQPFYDEDSSTLASGPADDDDWQRGSEFDVDEDDAISSDQENGVTFSPRRRLLNMDE